MKMLVACYSYTGNTLKAAEALQRLIGADLTRIEALKDRWYLFKAYYAIKEKKVPIKPCITDLKDYDGIIICCPVWAGKTPSAVNEYLSKLENVRGKKFAILITSGGGKQQKASVRIKEQLEKCGARYIDMLRILEKDINNDEYLKKVESFAKKF
ncbi:flavodoxin [Methanocella sp. CWC-04]|uniref:Flavodoxin n=1 Tax=Methanooceanicella nereidis TaxID=2052831 RepID=A0AAP2RAX4_9EURY|nr:NAD(P)H-dependent oxidoreductase [Methanocella sp. CWC-04]MCD1294154.1 flavodoxin [Methanocella sp. CWC-04]